MRAPGVRSNSLRGRSYSVLLFVAALFGCAGSSGDAWVSPGHRERLADEIGCNVRPRVGLIETSTMKRSSYLVYCRDKEFRCEERYRGPGRRKSFGCKPTTLPQDHRYLESPASTSTIPDGLK